MPPYLHHSRRGKALGVGELIAIGVGGMIGGGIFSILGIGAQIAGKGVVAALGIGGAVAFFAGYSYVKLAATFPTDGASYTYVTRAWPAHPGIGAITGWTVIIGYVGTLSLYAFTFGAYGGDLLGAGDNAAVRITLSAAILLAILAVNLFGARMAGVAEDIVVYTKIAILALFAIAGLVSADNAAQMPAFDQGIGSVFMAGALIFVAFEGFQLITNAIQETDDPRRNVPRGVYWSIGIVTLIYITLAYVATIVLPIDQLVAAREYALAVVAKPVLGELGVVLVGVAALLATSSAINGTEFGASRMMADMAANGIMPAAFERPDAEATPRTALLTLSGLGLGLTLFGSLEVIASFSSMTFLLVSLMVSVANLRLRDRTESRTWIIVSGIALMSATIILLCVYLALHDAGTLAMLGGFYLFAVAARMAFAVWHDRRVTPAP